MVTITYTQVQQLVERLPETQLALAYHFRHFDIKLRVVPKNGIIPLHFKIQYLGDCF